MTLLEVYETKYPEAKYIAVFEGKESPDPRNIEPDYADEYLETHGDREVVDYWYSEENKLIVAQLKETL